MIKRNLILSGIVLVLTETVPTQPNTHSTEEWKLLGLTCLTPKEVQAKATNGGITNYKDIDNKIVEDALGKHFKRIPYISSDACNMEGK